MKKVFLIIVMSFFVSSVFSQSKLKRDVMEAKQILIVNGYSIDGISNDSIIAVADSLKLVTQYAMKKYVDDNGGGFVADGVTINPLTGSVDTVDYIATKNDLLNVTGQLKFFETKDSIPDDLDYGELVKIEDTGAEYLIVNESYGDSQVDSFGVVKLLSDKFAILQPLENGRYNLIHFGANGSDNLNDDLAFERAIKFQNLIGNKFSIQLPGGEILISKKVDLTKTAFDKVEITGLNTVIKYIQDTITSMQVFNITSNDVLLDGFNVDGEFENLVDIYDTITSSLTDWNLGSNTSYDGEKIIFSNTGYAAISDGYAVNAGDKFLIQIQVDTASSSSNTFRWFGDYSVSIAQGYNEFIYEPTQSGTLIQLIAFNPSYMEVSDIKILKITGQSYTKEWQIPATMATVNDAIFIKTRSTLRVNTGNCIIKNVRVDNHPNRAINIVGNSLVGFKEVFVDNTHGNYTSEFCIVNGYHENVRIQNSSNVRNRDLGYTGGLKAYSVNTPTNNSNGVRTLSSFENINVKYGGLGGASVFLSGGFKSSIINNLQIEKYGYYVDTLKREIAYEAGGGTDPNRINSSGGSSITKIDPVLFYEDQRVLISNVNIVNSNDTSSLFMPIVYGANGTHNVRISNVNSDYIAFSLKSSEGPTSTNGSESGRFYISDCVFDVSDSFTSVQEGVIFDGCTFFGEIATNPSPPSGNPINWARFSEYPDSVASLASTEALRIIGGEVHNSKLYGASITLGDVQGFGGIINNVNVEGNGRINITRDNSSPQDTILMNISDYEGGLTFNFRNLGLGGTQYVPAYEKLFLNIKDSRIKIINQGGGANYEKTFNTLPKGKYDNVQYLDYKITRTDADNFVYQKIPIEKIYDVNFNTSARHESNIRIKTWSSSYNLVYDSLMSNRNQIVTVWDETGNPNGEVIYISFDNAGIAGIANDTFNFNKPFGFVQFENKDGEWYVISQNGNNGDYYYDSDGDLGSNNQVLSSTGNGSNWVDVSGNNLYNSDGTLTGNRTITMGSNDLTLQGINGSNVNSTSFDNNINSFSITNGANTTTLEHRATGLDLKLNRFKIINDSNNQLLLTDSESNNTLKNATINGAHYQNSEEAVTMLYLQASSAANSLRFGGGTSGGNSATIIDFHTSFDNTTTTGTRRMRIDNDGLVSIGLFNSPFAKLNVKGIGTTSSTLVFETEDSNDATTFKIADDGTVTIYADIIIDAGNNVRIITGLNSPEGTVTAGVGSTFHRTNGGSGSSFYVKESGSGPTGWVAK